MGRSGERFADPKHPYARDLDIFGRGSLFELLSAARTEPGEATLAHWLLEAADVETINQRQVAVAELRGRLDLREKVALLGADVEFDLSPDELAAWGEAPPAVTSRWPVLLATAAAAINIASLAAWWWLPYGSIPLLPAILAGGGFALLWRRRVGEILGHSTRPRQQLLLLAEFLRLLETESLSAPALMALQRRLDRSGAPASQRVRQLARLVEWNDSRRNFVFAPLAAVLMLGSQLAFAIERWRHEAGRDISRWLAAVGELEALSSLAGFSYENPEDPFPTVLDEGPVFEAAGLGHPLLSPARCVANDVMLGAELRLLLISGSNMSGKSTLLRSVGVNVVLALAGATVRARELRLSQLEVGASLQVVDSLQEGTSHFYAEITRLRQISELTAKGSAVLFLLDEILHGTNSHDRRIGAEGVIQSLVAGGGLGLVTTHDLALAGIADELGSRAANVHFEDRIEEGRMIFDYRLREGVVEKSNALDLMRGLGLDV